MRRLLNTLLAILASLAALLVGAGQLGGLQGTLPADLGVKDGRLKPPSATPNSVSSQALLQAGHARQHDAMIAPLPLQGEPAAAITRLRSVVEAMPGAAVVTQRDDYLYVRFSTRWLGFVDDAEFWADAGSGAIQVRSASRLGSYDFGANRARIEKIRAQLTLAQVPRSR